MLAHVLAAAESLEPERLIVVVGSEADEVEAAFAGRGEFVVQAEPRGTGHAVLQAAPKLSDFDGDVLVLYGDVPLLRPQTLEAMRLEKQQGESDLVILTATAASIPGRIVRDATGCVTRVVEQQDASAEELAIPERNTGVYLLDAQLPTSLPRGCSLHDQLMLVAGTPEEQFNEALRPVSDSQKEWCVGMQLQASGTFGAV